MLTFSLSLSRCQFIVIVLSRFPEILQHLRIINSRAIPELFMNADDVHLLITKIKCRIFTISVPSLEL